MTQEQVQNDLRTWAILEIFGHQKYAGFVTVQTFGTAVMFRLDVPALKEREIQIRQPRYLEIKPGDFSYAPPGAVVREPATQGYTKFFGVGAIYALTPCEEEAALAAVEEIQPRPAMLISLPKSEVLPRNQAYLQQDNDSIFEEDTDG